MVKLWARLDQNMDKIGTINWTYFSHKINWAKFGQILVHKLVLFWSKYGKHILLDKLWAKYGKNMVHKLGKIWARFGQNRGHGFAMYCVYGFVGSICDGYWSKCGIKY